MAAVHTGNIELMRLVCKLRPGSEDCAMCNDKACLVLGYTATRGENKMVKVLLEAGGDPNQPPP